MPTPSESRQALTLITGEAGRAVTIPSGDPEAVRLSLLDTVPGVIGYYAQGSAALAADLYAEQRDAAAPRTRFAPKLVVLDRVVKQRRAIVWSADPLFAGDTDLASRRLSGVLQEEVARPYRATILTNRRDDPDCVGWRREIGVCCRFCRMLGDRGAVYKRETARFAAHPHCDCTAVPVFRGGEVGPEATALQYTASRRSRTPAQRAALREYLDTVYGPD